MESHKYKFFVDRDQINYIRTTLESYDGVVVVRTLDPSGAIIQLHVAPGCEEFVWKVLESLKTEGLRIRESCEE
ncbi:MAG: DUF4911 domain-containing protein [Deltaproteobacteria bacterium]|nr:DUF4911 domain-containing protein [Deltaproteobacteria bacterium]MBW1930527.1 DUF4911 domain-containing protein [Deltaproteobacteria bacterium]MBW2025927.1 DUF4911 domain-containing protein [Deltaproteobacteria bacterium]MBW2125709.1 DUF4911 domain-containing protein [Deltaproteobacteria bacterium]RLB11659.1 MAG: DUF4911 domain-containing protein [Deltaproteobacteria bacterium]